ncbi:MAG TPA: hypothetical protein VIY28_12620 [Pseudonocardiaceae bacterium]
MISRTDGGRAAGADLPSEDRAGAPPLVEQVFDVIIAAASR